MGQLHHPNLVKLIGYCLEDDLRLLVYEFVPNGNLEYHLFGSKWYVSPFWFQPSKWRCMFSCNLNRVFVGAGDSYFQPLSWDLYVKVSHGAAKALAFLHYKADVIYRNFKTSNILLDSVCENFSIANFGFCGGYNLQYYQLSDFFFLCKNYRIIIPSSLI